MARSLSQQVPELTQTHLHVTSPGMVRPQHHFTPRAQTTVRARGPLQKAALTENMSSPCGCHPIQAPPFGFPQYSTTTVERNDSPTNPSLPTSFRAILSASTEELPWAMLAKGPACTNTGVPYGRRQRIKNPKDKWKVSLGQTGQGGPGFWVLRRVT